MIFRLLSIVFIINICLSCSNNKQSNSQQDKKLDSLINYYKKQKFVEKKHFFDSISKQNLENVSPEIQAKIFFNLSSINIASEKYREALNFTNKSEKYYKTKNNNIMLWKCNINKGIIYTYLKKNDSALYCTYKALELAEKLNDYKYKTSVYANLGHIYYLNNDIDKSLEFMLKIVDIQKKEKKYNSLAATYQNIGILYKNKNKLNIAYSYMKKSLKIKDSISDDYLGDIYTNLANISLKLNKNKDSIIQLYNKAILIHSSQGKNNTKAYIGKANTYLKFKQIDSAIYFYQKALSLSKNNNDKKDILDKLIGIAIDAKDIQKLQKLYQTKDSIILKSEKEKTKEKIKLLEENYKLNIKKIKLKNEKEKLQKNVYFYLISIFALILLAGLLSLYFYNKNLKNNKEKILLEQKVLRSQLNPHFIFNSLTAIQNSLVTESPLRSVSYLSRFAKLIRKTFNFINQKNISINQEIEFIKEYVDMQNARRKNNISLVINIDKNISAVNTVIPPLLLQPIVENSFEHSFLHSNNNEEIIISIKEIKNKICFEISDNGTPLIKEKNTEKREHALNILKKRIALFNGKSHSDFTIDITKKGTQVRFCITKKTIY